MTAQVIEVFADVSCPFAHVGLQRFARERARRGGSAPRLRVRAWPLEVVNGAALTGDALTPKVAALHRDIAPDLFERFDPTAVPASTLEVLAAEAGGYRQDPIAGERFSLAVRHLLFDEGRDPSQPAALRALLADHGLAAPSGADADTVLADHAEGVTRGVQGSPHFFVHGHGYFCPTLDVGHDDDGYHITFDVAGFDRFAALAFG